MGNEIQIAENKLSSTNTPTAVFKNSGDNGLQISNQGTINVFMTANNGGVYNAGSAISNAYYNLFVVGGEPFNEGHFLIEKDRALTTAEGIAPEISAEFAALTPEAIARIKTFPSLIAGENRQYGRTDTDHLAFFGMVTDIRIQENGIKIYFQKFCSLPQQRLNETMRELAIHGKPSYNELNRTHWAIKKVNLIEELKAAGISVLAPT